MEEMKLRPYYEFDPTILQIINKLKLHNKREYMHSYRVFEYSMHIEERMHIEENCKSVLATASLLHDIGKVSISNNILNKNSKLSDQEKIQIENHPFYGYNFLRKLGVEERICNIVHCHHERWNGCGYPNSLYQEKIDIGARIIAAADSFDAMITIRPYKGAMSIRDACKELKRYSNIMYDPEVVNALMEYIYDTNIINMKRRKTFESI